MHIVATCTVATERKINFIEVHNVFTFQKLLTCRSHISADYVPQD